MTAGNTSGAPAAYDSWITPQELAAKLEAPLDSICKLDANESPYGPPPNAIKALHALAQSRPNLSGVGRYPDAAALTLRQALAGYTGVAVENIVVGNGSDELIHLLVHLLLTANDQVVVAEPTFALYGLAARRIGAEVVDAGYDGDFQVTPERIVAAMTPLTRLVFLCSPNNPTGAPLRRETLLAALERADELARGVSDNGGPFIILDEAYYDIGALAAPQDAWTAASAIVDHPRLVVLRTFSKLFGLAGLRVGYALCNAALAARLRDLKQPYNVNSAGQIAARAALSDVNWLRDQARALVSERERLFRELREFPQLRVYPSSANFLFVQVREPKSAQTVWQRLLDRAIIVRLFSDARLNGFLRITVGTPEQNERLLGALRDIFSGGQAKGAPR
jgi:histidinol-phosphate aminotransferase